MIAQWTFAQHLKPPCETAKRVLDFDCVLIEGKLLPGSWWLLSAAVGVFLTHIVLVLVGRRGRY